MPTKARRTKADSPNALKYDSPKPIIEALIKTRGQQTIAADYLGISRKTLYDYRQRWPEIDEEIDTWRQRRLDRAEFKLDDAVENGESWAIMFLLNCLAKDRGYGNKVEQTTDATLRVIYGDDGNGQNTDNPASEAARTATAISIIEG